jgi:ribosomal protein S18 acetylase RimI-like enzyme
MAKRGRFGKYGEIKRLERLRDARSARPKHGKGNPPEDLRARRSSNNRLNREPRIRVRPTTAGDILFIERLSRKVFHAYGPYEEILPKWVGSDLTITATALKDGQPAGFAMVGFAHDRDSLQDDAELLAIAVEPGKQGMGIGTLLLQKVEKKAADLGVKGIFLHTAKGNLRARGLFSRGGYRAIKLKTGFYPEGQDAFMLYKGFSGSPSISG